jgi:hypothetical protein
MKKGILSIIIITLIFTFVGNFAIFADGSTTSELDMAPVEAVELSQQIGEPVVYIEDGLYSVGEEVFVDVTVYPGDYVDYILDDIYSDTGNSFTTATQSGNPRLRGNTPPSTGSVWDWANGSYSGSFTMNVRVFTNYRFTGYSSYKVTASVSNNGHTVTAGAFGIEGFRDNNSSVGKISFPAGTYTKSYTFTGLQPGNKIAFAVSKADDGTTVTGDITVTH